MSPLPKTARFSQCSQMPGRSVGQPSAGPFGGPFGGPISSFVGWLVGRFDGCFPHQGTAGERQRRCVGVVRSGSGKARRVEYLSNFVAKSNAVHHHPCDRMRWRRRNLNPGGKPEQLVHLPRRSSIPPANMTPAVMPLEASTLTARSSA